jgi:hypothetical protein
MPNIARWPSRAREGRLSQNAEQDLEGIFGLDSARQFSARLRVRRQSTGSTLRRRIYGIHGARDYAQIVFANDEPG